ncbi:hypothetical protein BAOM_2072 [Peribacillus asahii]|uniref:Uncharacterized protein n=1 Tax=Peribacillus asahii TaxID=228899 RepID=A0A3T0KR39_9BACI|nr:hypothetical protein BAOM_2072 [Peribacillus asahii]
MKDLKIPGFSVELSDIPSSVQRYPPLLGEHTDEVLNELDYSYTQIKELKRAKVF